MDRREAAARCLVVGFEGTTLPAETRALLAEGAAGAVLFRRNVESAEQVAALIAEIRAAAAPRKVLVAVDQEGGRVARLKGIATDLPPMRAVSAPDDARAVGALLGRECRALGFDVDFAPVVDVDTNPDNPVIGDRAFAPDPEAVAALSRAFVEGMQGAHLAACAKHFPGHGDTVVDSHLGLPRLAHDRARLDAVELPPFRAAAEAQVASMMTAHVILEALDPSLPATMSAAVMGLLRRDLGYDGLVFSDDLEMAAVADHFGLDEVGRWGLKAGVDVFLVCHRADRQHHLIEGIAQALAAGKLDEGPVEAAHRRLDALLARFDPAGPRPDPRATLRRRDHLELAARLAGGVPTPGADPTGGR